LCGASRRKNRPDKYQQVLNESSQKQKQCQCNFTEVQFSELANLVFEDLAQKRRSWTLGIEVPRHMSIIGIDNLSSSQQMTPKLTSMAVSRRETAQKILEMLEHLFRSGVGNASIHVVMQPQLYWHDSILFR
jgi:hypothetical protein